MLQVKAVQVLEGFWLRLTLSNGDVVERNVQDLIRGGVFEPLRQRRELFEAAFVDGSTVAWPGEVDIAPEPSSGTVQSRKNRLCAPSVGSD